jgi:2-succinyl-6-hydroxy-2,4-cyclohexadiene-1-carboxylate synthase
MKRLVLLHGFTGAPSSFDELCTLLRTRAGAAVAVYRPHILGHGVAADGVNTFDDEVTRLATELERGGLRGAHLCGYSLGARLALGLLARAPQLFVSATLIGVHPGLTTQAERSERSASDERWARMLEERGLEAFLSAWQEQPLFASQAALERAGGARAIARQRAIRSAHDARGLARSLRVLGLAAMPDYHATLLAPPVPTTLVVGANDTKFVELARASAERNPKLGLSLIEGSGHNVVLEAPDRLTDLLMQVLIP